MAQLKDDCFAFGGDLMPLADALQDIQSRVETVVGTEEVATGRCLGRVLSADLVSSRNVPPHDNSAVDGYAVFHDDLNDGTDTCLPFIGRIAAGHPLPRPARRGEALRIFTGAPMPAGADGTQATGPDTVFMEEDTSVDGDAVVLPSGLKRGANRRSAGEDIHAGDIIIPAGARLRAQELGLAASVGCSLLAVYKPLRVAVFSTGDEVRDPWHEAPDGCIFDANRYSLTGLLQGLGCDVTDLGILTDDRNAIMEALSRAAGDHDLILTSGGVSAGEEDHVKAAVEDSGSIHFWRLAIKPGRPIAMGRVGPAVFLGLPGNPVATMVTFMIIARPLILWLSGARDVEPLRFRALAGFSHNKKKGRREWVRARLVEDSSGELTAVKDHSGGAGILTSMVGASCLVELAEDVQRVTVGDRVSVLPFNEVTG